jgi:hypothetical protein
MPKFYVTNESTEDTFSATDNLQEAINVAQEVAKNGQVGDLVLVESSEGKGIKQFMRRSDGVVEEKEVA